MTTTTTDDELRAAVRRLGLYGLLAHWEEVRHSDWLPRLLDYEQTERQRRSLERRLGAARLDSFKPMADFDWQWPKKIDRLIHRAEIITIAGDSYRFKEARERAAQKAQTRKACRDRDAK